MIPPCLLFGLRDVCVHSVAIVSVALPSVAIFLWLYIHQEKLDPVNTGGLSGLPLPSSQ